MNKILAYSYSRYLNLLWGKQPQRKFFILTKSRSGSTLLTDLLNKHPNIYCDTELLNTSTHGKVLAPQVFIKAASKQFITRNVTTFGFKLFIYHLTEDYQIGSPKKFLEHFIQEGWKFIFLERTNVLLETFSLCEAHQRKRYHLPKNSSGKNDSELYLNVTEFLSLLEKRISYRKEEKKLLQSLPPHLSLVYENDLIDPEKQQHTCERIFDLLDLPREKISTKMKKINNAPLSSLIGNYEELHNAIQGTPFEVYL